jgi:hypothetical protein
VHGGHELGAAALDHEGHASILLGTRFELVKRVALLKVTTSVVRPLLILIAADGFYWTVERVFG